MRLEFAYTILRSLRVSSVASVVDQLWPLFHKDPVAYFPPEIVSLIFSYLEPRNLMDASRASRTWRARVLDSRLWKEKFKTEGWGLDMEEIERFERQYNLPKKATFTTSTRKTSQEHRDPRQESHDFSKVGNSFISNQRKLPDPPISKTLAPKQPSPEPSEDEEMPDAVFESSTFVRTKSLQDMDSDPSRSPTATQVELSPSPSSGTRPGQGTYQEESLMLYASPGHSRMNYHYIFKQKRKLEENWNAGRYRSFQLPHKDHPEDAHTECVYTIQYLGRHLVSGSRDRTLRIWNPYDWLSRRSMAIWVLYFVYNSMIRKKKISLFPEVAIAMSSSGAFRRARSSSNLAMRTKNLF